MLMTVAIFFFNLASWAQAGLFATYDILDEIPA